MEVIVTPIVEQKVFNVTVSNGGGGGGGGQGPRGYNGWSPMTRKVEDGERVVNEIYDWFGGTGTKPTVTGYEGPDGLTQNIADATDVRGPSGEGTTDAETLQGQDGAFYLGRENGTGEQNMSTVTGLVDALQSLNTTLGGKATGQDIVNAINALNLGTASQASTEDFATSEQGALAETAIQEEDDPTVPEFVKTITESDISGWDSKATSSDISQAISNLNLGTAAQADGDDFATAAQGALADTAVQPAGLPTWTTISGKPSFVAEGANAAAARTALGLGTAATQASGAFATAAQGAKADTAVQSAQEGGVGVLVSNIIQVTQAQYDGLTPQAGTFYAIVG